MREHLFMSRNLDRLRKGERWWTAEVILRSIGILLLSTCYRLGIIAHRWVTAQPMHQATLREFAACLAIVVCLTSGLALTMFGPKLFEHVPIPRNSAYFTWK
jgi:uncharacterized membrane protein